MSAPVLLTGATGFLGRELARQLVEGGREVHALHRKSSDRSPLDGLSLHWQPAELGDALRSGLPFAVLARAWTSSTAPP